MSSSSDEYESTDRSGDPGDLPSSEYKLTESGSGESGGVMAETKSVETSASSLDESSSDVGYEVSNSLASRSSSCEFSRPSISSAVEGSPLESTNGSVWLSGSV
jgi:hypothetical protein